MIHRFLTMLAAVALIGVCCDSEADGAGYRSRARKGVYRPTVKRCVYPRYRQIDGKSLWNLGKQNGSWPKL